MSKDPQSWQSGGPVPVPSEATLARADRLASMLARLEAEEPTTGGKGKGKGRRRGQDEGDSMPTREIDAERDHALRIITAAPAPAPMAVASGADPDDGPAKLDALAARFRLLAGEMTIGGFLRQAEVVAPGATDLACGGVISQAEHVDYDPTHPARGESTAAPPACAAATSDSGPSPADSAPPPLSALDLLDQYVFDPAPSSSEPMAPATGVRHPPDIDDFFAGLDGTE